jgi:hypothetical protein
MFRVTAPHDDVEVHVFRRVDGVIVAMQRDKHGEGTEEVTLALPRSMSITDISTGTSLGRVQRLNLALDPIMPTLLFASEL